MKKDDVEEIKDEFEENVSSNPLPFFSHLSRRSFLKVSAATAAVTTAMVSGLPGIGKALSRHNLETVEASIDTVIPGQDTAGTPGAVDVPQIVLGIFAALTTRQIRDFVRAIDSTSADMYGNDFLDLDLTRRTEVFDAMQTNTTLKTIIDTTLGLYYLDKEIGENHTYAHINYDGWVWGHHDWACQIDGTQGNMQSHIGSCKKFH